MLRATRCFTVALALVWSLTVHADQAKFMVIKSEQARFIFPNVGRSSWTAEETAAYRPPFARVTRSFNFYTSGPYKGHHETLIDNGRGNSMSGYVKSDDVAVFNTQAEAEAYALDLDETRAHYEPVLEEHGETGLSAARPSGSDHDSQGPAPARVPPAPRPGSATAEVTSSLANQASQLASYSTHAETRAAFESIRQKLRTKLGSAFLAKLRSNYAPSRQDRIKLISAAASALDAKERALFALVATSWAEERNSLKDPRCGALTSRSPASLLASCREDPVGRANMAFTMKIIDNRAEPLLAHAQFASPASKNKSKLQRYWSVVTDNHGAFSSWNIGSKNFGNMLRNLLGSPEASTPTEKSALDRALATYRDFSSGKIDYQGFTHNGHRGVSMLNKKEVKDTRARTRFVSWSVEGVMRNGRSGTLHEVGLRVPSFSIALPAAEGSDEKIKVPPADIGHWPVYLTRIKRQDMEAARMTQGGW
jgi:hypothetical protein